jgi:hypothetical protein
MGNFLIYGKRQMLECLGMANRMFVEQQGSNVQLLLRMFGEKVYIYIYITNPNIQIKLI